jgi:hypothetical protein
MQLVQDIGSGDTLAQSKVTVVTDSSISKHKGWFGHMPERAQQALLLTTGLTFMGLVLLLLDFIAQPKPRTPDSAKIHPAVVTKPTAHSTDTKLPVLKAVKI